MVSASVRRQQIAYVCQRGRSIRRACALLRVARSTVQYQPRLAQRDAAAVAVMHELAAQYPRYGYRRIQVFLERRGHVDAMQQHQLLARLGNTKHHHGRSQAQHKDKPLHDRTLLGHEVKANQRPDGQHYRKRQLGLVGCRADGFNLSRRHDCGISRLFSCVFSDT